MQGLHTMRGITDIDDGGFGKVSYFDTHGNCSVLKEGKVKKGKKEWVPRPLCATHEKKGRKTPSPLIWA